MARRPLESHILNQLVETRCYHMWQQHAETRCVITMNKLNALSHFGLRIQGETRTVAGQRGPGKDSLIKLLVKQVLETPNKNQMMAALFPK